jgi:hypothetical protein
MCKSDKSDLKFQVPKVTKVNAFCLFYKKDKAEGRSTTLAHLSSFQTLGTLNYLVENLRGLKCSVNIIEPRGPAGPYPLSTWFP